MTAYRIGDFVWHEEMPHDGDDRKSGYVCGFCPAARWIRVRSFDGRYRIWLRDHVHNQDAEIREVEKSC